MASSIDTGINRDFPVAGIDNDTQGFRDNFSIIQNSFVSAKEEIEELQDITAKTTSSNSFNDFFLSDAVLVNISNKGVVGSEDPTRHNVEFSTNGYLQYLKVNSGENPDGKEIQISGIPAADEDLVRTGTILIAVENTSTTLDPVDITFTKSATEFGSNDKFFLGTGFTGGSPGYTITPNSVVFFKISFVSGQDKTVFINVEDTFEAGVLNT